jgi:hypothetical protein
MNDTDAAVADAVTDLVADGRHAAIVHAPRAAASLDALEQAVWQVLDPDLVDLAARLCARVHGLLALARPAALGPSPFSDRDVALWRTFDDLRGAQRAALVFAEQFTTDVSSVTTEQRDALQDAFGEHALVFAHVLYVVDVAPGPHSIASSAGVHWSRRSCPSTHRASISGPRSRRTCASSPASINSTPSRVSSSGCVAPDSTTAVYASRCAASRPSRPAPTRPPSTRSTSTKRATSATP